VEANEAGDVTHRSTERWYLVYLGVYMGRKAIVLIDGGYFDFLNYYLKNGRRKSIDIETFSSEICKKIGDDVIHVRTKFYHANPYKSDVPTPQEAEKYRKAQKFFHSINTKPNHEFFPVGRVKPIRVHCPHCKTEFKLPKQKGVDVGLALDLIRMAKEKVADIFVLVCGDEDLTDAVKMAKEYLCQVYVFYSYDKSANIYGSIKLNEAADNRINMDLDFLENCSKD